MFRRKAFLHWYTGEGMDEMEFTEVGPGAVLPVVYYVIQNAADLPVFRQCVCRVTGEDREGDHMMEPV